MRRRGRKQGLGSPGLADDAVALHLLASGGFSLNVAIVASDSELLKESLFEGSADLGPVLDGGGPIEDSLASNGQIGIAGGDVKCVLDASLRLHLILGGLESDRGKTSRAADASPFLPSTIGTLHRALVSGIDDASTRCIIGNDVAILALALFVAFGHLERLDVGLEAKDHKTLLFFELAVRIDRHLRVSCGLRLGIV